MVVMAMVVDRDGGEWAITCAVPYGATTGGTLSRRGRPSSNMGIYDEITSTHRWPCRPMLQYSVHLWQVFDPRPFQGPSVGRSDTVN
jgi:hypothetical protein